MDIKVLREKESYLEEREATVILEQNAASAPDITRLCPAQLCKENQTNSVLPTNPTTSLLIETTGIPLRARNSLSKSWSAPRLVFLQPASSWASCSPVPPPRDSPKRAVLTQNHFWGTVVPGGHDGGVVLVVEGGAAEVGHADARVPDGFLLAALRAKHRAGAAVRGAPALPCLQLLPGTGTVEF